jgi:hypothetical protein
MAEEIIYRVEIDHNISGETDTKMTGEPLPTSSAQQKAVSGRKTKAFSSVAKLAGVAIGKQALTWTTSNYGNLTGDYIGQEKINSTIEVSASVGAIIASPLLGSLAVGAGLAVKAIDKTIETKKNNQIAIQLRERTQGATEKGSR